MKRVWSVIYLPFPYTYYERIKLEIAAFDGVIRDTQFGAEVELELLIAQGQAQAFLDRITDMTSGQVEGLLTGQEYRAFPVSGKEEGQ
jgi:putative IMPACT (imprinted ancient) family translation regulator